MSAATGSQAPALLSNDLAEQAVLGCLMRLQLEVAKDLVADLRAEDFGNPHHRAVFDSIRLTLEQGVPADPVTVLNLMRAQGDALIDHSGAGPFLINLLQAAPSHASASYYARGLRTDALRRRVQEAGIRLQQAAEGESIDSLRDLITAELAAVCESLARIGEETP